MDSKIRTPLNMDMLGFMFVLCVIKASAEAISLAKPDCQEKCGNIDIPYPFGIGANCSGHETFAVTCNSSFNPPKPFMNIIDLEVLEISLQGTAHVNQTVLTSNCLGRTNRLDVNLLGSPFTFSDANRFTAMGCDNLALINRQSTTIGGCMSFCNTTSRENSCYGINCCQTRIPPSLKFINATFRSINSNNDERGCKYAFMVDQEWFSNLASPYNVQSMENVPAVLDWRTYSTCTSYNFSSNSNRSVSLCGNNAYCNQSLCSCLDGYKGNPYLPDGCTDINECEDPIKNRCQKICVNTLGSYRCVCPSGYSGDGYKCYKANGASTLIIGIGSGLGILFLLIGTWWFCKLIKRRKKTKRKEKFFKRNGGLLLQQQLSSGEEGNVEKTKLFTSKELEKATDKYNENRILGHGGQGTVYKGMLTDGRIVAIKKSKIEDENQLEQFINEVVILSQINHRNVVKLHGCCLETEVPMLVYEFISNGTLFQYIHDQNEEMRFSWDMRLRVSTEVAGALSYLHSAASIPIYHRDIKSTNILLDDKYRAKVADFGTSRTIAIEQTHLTTRVLGTFGYLDPEYFQSSQFTEKSDVYSFGVVLIELLTGQKPISSARTETEEGRSLATHFILAMKENRLFDILDAEIAKEGRKEEIMRVANLAKRCLNLNGRKRPTMKEVAMELEVIKTSNGAPTTQEPSESHDAEYAAIEIAGPWDAPSSSTGSFANNSTPSSLDEQPLLFE